MPSETLPVSAPRQVRPATEGWSQKLDTEGRPLLQFSSPKRGKPPAHLADLTAEERKAKLINLGLPAFRARQISTHYFTHLTGRPAHMPDLPAAPRQELVAGLLPPLISSLPRLAALPG